jgi:hypothetical protein
MPDNETIDVEKIVADARERVARERAEGLWEDADELARLALDVPAPGAFSDGFDLGGVGARIRFRPELGFSSKPVIGRPITAVKRLNLRMLHYVLDDLARQADAAVRRLEAALGAEVAARERAERAAEDAVEAERSAREALEIELDELSKRLAAVERT